jgi:transposase
MKIIVRVVSPGKGDRPLIPLDYYDMVRAKDKCFDIRLAMAKKARTQGIRKAAREFGVSRNTIRLWLRRYEKGGPSALKEKSRAPKSCPHKTSSVQEKKILDARHQVPCFGPRRLKDYFGLKPSAGAISRILRQNKLTERRRKKYKKKNDLREIKARYRVFERLQMDTKPLRDIPAYWVPMKALGLPEHQYTIRDVKSGALYIDYAGSLSTTYALLCFKRLAGHLERFGANLSGTILSTDNGGEFGGTEKRERSSVCIYAEVRVSF